MRRRTVLKGLTAAAAVPLLAACDAGTLGASAGSSGRTGPFSLVFDKSKYTVHTQTVANTAHTVVGNLAALASNLGDNVNSSMYWDGGHAVNYDAPEFIRWIATLTSYTG